MSGCNKVVAALRRSRARIAPVRQRMKKKKKKVVTDAWGFSVLLGIRRAKKTLAWRGRSPPSPMLSLLSARVVAAARPQRVLIADTRPLVISIFGSKVGKRYSSMRDG